MIVIGLLLGYIAGLIAGKSKTTTTTVHRERIMPYSAPYKPLSAAEKAIIAHEHDVACRAQRQ
jgi:hypothetical protein